MSSRGENLIYVHRGIYTSIPVKQEVKSVRGSGERVTVSGRRKEASMIVIYVIIKTVNKNKS